MPAFLRFILPALAVLLLFSGCMASGGVYHTVGRGETLWRISYTYGKDLSEVARANRIRDPKQLETGMKIFIPGAKKRLKVTPYPARASLDKDTGGTVSGKKRPRYKWPVDGRVVSAFGMRNGSMHDGIDIKAPENAPIRAAENGTVVYESDVMRGYGNIIIIKHVDNYYTVYAHNKQNLAKEGDKVSSGDVIGKVGNTGNATTFQLHFEVREGRTSVNPLFFLP